MASPLATILAHQAPAQNMPTPNVNPTDVSGIYKSSYDAAMEKYKADMARNNAMWGGLAGLGGAGIQAFGPKLFGAATGAPAAQTGIAGMIAEAPWLMALI